MLKTVDVNQELSGLKTLEGRGPDTTEAQASFAKFAEFERIDL